MPDLKSIPDDVKWRLAADFAARLPALYDGAFRTVLGAKFDDIEREIWVELSRRAYTIAQDLSLPVNGAHDLAESMHIVMTILFGPEFRSETLDVSEDASVILIKRCPLLSVAHETGASGEHTFPKCMALTLTTIPALKKDYSARYVRSMCTGDRQCEIKISAEKKPETTEHGNKKKR
jgi:predicted ArsR family transcriptional regulator